MWCVYDADQHKPLPPLRTANGDEVEPLDLLKGDGASGKRARDRRDDRRGRDDRRDRDRDYRSPRDRGGDRRDRRDYQRAGPPKPPPGAKQEDPRKPPSYNDVDAPKRPVLNLDFGVLLPPPKKKKKSQG